MPRIKKILAALLLVLFVIPFSVVPATAETPASITIEYEPGVCSFDFFKISELSEDGTVTPCAPFDGYEEISALDEELCTLDSEELRILSFTLEAVILRDKIAPKYAAQTDENGTLTLDNIEKGVYLVIGEKSSDDSYVYTPLPFIVSLPHRSSTDSAWQYEITVEHTKYEKEELSESDTDYSVKKIWSDKGNESKRPVSISVCLLRDGELYDTVVLNVANNWSYQWKELSREHTWTAVEKSVPAGYTMTAEKNGTAFIIKNTSNTPPPPPPEEIPPTGQLWWPVPILLIAGSIFFMTGWLCRRYL